MRYAYTQHTKLAEVKCNVIALQLARYTSSHTNNIALSTSACYGFTYID